jgi:hypothetical protein
MTTLRPGGSLHVMRIGVALVDGNLWSSGTQARVRTAHVRRDPRPDLFVFDTDLGDLAVARTGDDHLHHRGSGST